MDDEMKQQFHALAALIEGLKDSLEREIRGVGDRVDRMSARLDKIAAGSHYVTRLVEWSEKQDQFQADALRRFTELDARLRKLEAGQKDRA